MVYEFNFLALNVKPPAEKLLWIVRPHLKTPCFSEEGFGCKIHSNSQMHNCVLLGQARHYVSQYIYNMKFLNPFTLSKIILFDLSFEQLLKCYCCGR